MHTPRAALLGPLVETVERFAVAPKSLFIGSALAQSPVELLDDLIPFLDPPTSVSCTRFAMNITTTLLLLLSLLAVVLDASARGGVGAAAISRGAGAAVPRGAGSAAAMSRGPALGGISAAFRAGAAASMLRAGRSSEFTVPIEVGFERGILSIRGGNGVLRNADGTVAAHLRPSGKGITFYESDGTTLRGYAEEFNGTIRLYRVGKSDEFIFEASEPIQQRNEATGARYNMTPTRTYRDNGVCRAVLDLDGRRETYCRQSNGDWEPVR